MTAPLFDPAAIAAALAEQTSTTQGRQLLQGLTRQQPTEVARHAGYPVRGDDRTKTAIIDSLVHHTIAAPAAFRRALGEP